jgi:putative ABC transport system ATP-binding protein
MTLPCLVRCRAVHKSFARSPRERIDILLGIDFELVAGQLTLVHGASGTGKSTLLAILGCLLQPERGTLELLDRPVDFRDEEGLAALRAAHYGYVFQDHRLFDALTARENVELALALKGIGRSAAATSAAHALAEVGVGELADAKPARMSGGQRQRVSIARAIAGRPSVLLCDEPTASVDVKTALQLGELLRQLVVGTNRTALVVTHDEHLRRFSDHVLVLQNGRLVPLSAEAARCAG